MSTKQTTFSIEETLHKRREAAAEELHISYNELAVQALQEFLLRRENREITARLNEVYSGEPDPEEQRFLKAAKYHMRLILERENEEW